MPEIEAEVALLIASHDAPRVADAVARLTAVAGFVLTPEPPQDIRDTYVDTADLALTARQVALRVRTVAARAWITLKGPRRSMSWGGREAVELEAPWSRDALGHVIDALGQYGVIVPVPPVASHASPPTVLEALGLRVVQDRHTSRRPRRVTRHDDPEARWLAELTVDAVTYHLHSGQAQVHEVEIECKAEDGAGAAAALSADLRARFGEALRPWPYGKLATGRAIELMLRQGTQPPVLAAGGTLSPAVVDLLSLWLARGVAQPRPAGPGGEHS